MTTKEENRLRDLVRAAFHEGHLEGVTSPDTRPDVAWQNSESLAKLENTK